MNDQYLKLVFWEKQIMLIKICGETEFIEQMYSDYNQMALEREVALVPACGYDSVPADFKGIGTCKDYTQRELNHWNLKGRF